MWYDLGEFNPGCRMADGRRAVCRYAVGLDRGSDRLLAKSKRAWTCLSVLTQGRQALITGYWSLSETQNPCRPTWSYQHGANARHAKVESEEHEHANKQANIPACFHRRYVCMLSRTHTET